MRRRTWPGIVLILTVPALGLAGCAEPASTVAAKKESPAHIEQVEGTTQKRVVLVPKAAERLAIQTVPVRPATPQEMAGLVPAGQGVRTAVPDAAVLYDKTGATFTYINPKDHDYVHQPITVEGIRNKVAILAAGPPAGTAVVTAGGTELYGVETGVGK